jgi:hypothetical protein
MSEEDEKKFKKINKKSEKKNTKNNQKWWKEKKQWINRKARKKIDEWNNNDHYFEKLNAIHTWKKFKWSTRDKKIKKYD